MLYVGRPTWHQRGATCQLLPVGSQVQTNKHSHNALVLRGSITVEAPYCREADSACSLCAGWFNLLGQVAITAGIDFSLTNHIACMWALSNGHILTQKELLAVYGGVHVFPGQQIQLAVIKGLILHGAVLGIISHQYLFNEQHSTGPACKAG